MIDPARASAYLRILAVAMAVFALGATGHLLGSAWNDPLGRPPIGDFDAFWSAARLGAAGHAGLAYDQPAIQAAEAVGVQPTGGPYLPYFYPPIFTALCLPLAFLPYLPALGVFVAGTAAILAACLRRILPPAFPTLAILAFPGLVSNAVIGQNGALSGACFAGGLLLLERRPGLAGACLGLLSYRPQLAVCVPVALLAALRWRALAGFAGMASGLVLISATVLGWQSWRDFAAALPMIGRVPALPDIAPKLLSVFAAVRLLHGPAGLALAAQGAAAVAAASVLAWIAARRPGAGAEISALVAASLLASPYLLDYDLACLGVPLAWLAGRRAGAAWPEWEKTGLMAIYALPLVARMLNLYAHLPLTPVFLAMLLALVGRAALRPLQSLGNG